VDLGLSDTQVMLKESLAKLLAANVSHERLRQLQSDGVADDLLWSRLAAGGWLSLPLPESRGGGGATLMDVAVAVEEIARAAAVVPVAETYACAVAVSNYGTEEAAGLIAAGLGDGSVSLTAAVIDGAGGAAIVVDGRLSGLKKFVDYGQTCSHHLVVASEHGQEGVYLVAAGSAGVSSEPLSTIGQTPQANVRYESAAALRAGGPECAAELSRLATMFCSAQLLAYADVALGMTVDYVRNRVQFGRPLGAFQAVQHHCADMATALESARFLIYETIWKLQHGEARAEDLAMAKAIASRTGVFVTMQAHQLHGGMGVTDEYPLQFYSRRAKERSVAWGSEHESLRVLAGAVESAEKWI
jgi:alkylation response protein AidB-like acyl-CoA dehydrogenase